MPYAEPVPGNPANYNALFETTDNVIDGASNITISVTPSEEGWTEEGLDNLFQQLIDLVEGSGLYELGSASKRRWLNTTITPTPAAEEPDESA